MQENFIFVAYVTFDMTDKLRNGNSDTIFISVRAVRTSFHQIVNRLRFSNESSFSLININDSDINSKTILVIVR